MSQTLNMQYESQMFSSIGKDNKTAVITVNLADSAWSLNAIHSLQGMEKNISNLSLINGINHSLWWNNPVNL